MASPPVMEMGIASEALQFLSSADFRVEAEVPHLSARDYEELDRLERRGASERPSSANANSSIVANDEYMTPLQALEKYLEWHEGKLEKERGETKTMPTVDMDVLVEELKQGFERVPDSFDPRVMTAFFQMWETEEGDEKIATSFAKGVMKQEGYKSALAEANKRTKANRLAFIQTVRDAFVQVPESKYYPNTPKKFRALFKLERGSQNDVVLALRDVHDLETLYSYIRRTLAYRTGVDKKLLPEKNAFLKDKIAWNRFWGISATSVKKYMPTVRKGHQTILDSKLMGMVNAFIKESRIAWTTPTDNDGSDQRVGAAVAISKGDDDETVGGGDASDEDVGVGGGGGARALAHESAKAEHSSETKTLPDVSIRAEKTANATYAILQFYIRNTKKTPLSMLDFFNRLLPDASSLSGEIWVRWMAWCRQWALGNRNRYQSEKERLQYDVLVCSSLALAFNQMGPELDPLDVDEIITVATHAVDQGVDLLISMDIYDMFPRMVTPSNGSTDGSENGEVSSSHAFFPSGHASLIGSTHGSDDGEASPIVNPVGGPAFVDLTV